MKKEDLDFINKQIKKRDRLYANFIKVNNLKTYVSDIDLKDPTYIEFLNTVFDNEE